MIVLLEIAVTESKVYPADTNREFMCPPSLTSEAQLPNGYAQAQQNLNDVTIHEFPASLQSVLSRLNNTVVIAVKRVFNASTNTSTPFFKYYGRNETFAVETWSSSKIFSAMNGAGRLGQSCLAVDKEAGLEQETHGTYGLTPLGDLVTIIVTYDTTHPPYSSNALGGWFEMVGTRARARWLIHEWLRRPTQEWLGANYGMNPPTDLQFNFTNPTHPHRRHHRSNKSLSSPSPLLTEEDVASFCDVAPDTPDNGFYNNTLCALSMAEMVKRIVLRRELPEAHAFPNTTWEDSKVLLYGAGANASLLFPGRVWGGMSAIEPDSLHLGLNMSYIRSRAESGAGGGWRTFGKDGAGYSYIRYAGELLYNGYACYPDAPNHSNGVEYILSSRVSVPLDTHLTVASADFVAAMSAINEAVVNGTIE